MAIDTPKVARRLREAGFTEPQAEAVVTTMQEAAVGADLATKADLDALRSELKADIAEVRSELREIELRLAAKIRESELRLDAKIEAMKADILSRVFGLILGSLVINVIAIIGAVVAAARLVGH
jgi:hypothetical protein